MKKYLLNLVLDLAVDTLLLALADLAARRGNKISTELVMVLQENRYSIIAAMRGRLK